MTTETQTPLAGEQQAPSLSTTQSQPSQDQQTPPPSDDLVTGAEAKAGDAAPKADDAPPEVKAPETPADKRAYLEGKEGADKEALKGKTDEEIEKLFTDEKTKEAEAAALGDFDVTKLTLPEDMPIPEEMKGKVNDLAKIFNNKELSAQEKFQKAVDLHVEMQNKNLSDFVAVKTEWRENCLKDPEIGAGSKEKLEKAAGAANDVVRKFAGDAKQLEDFQGALKYLGLGNHPAFVRFCLNISKATSEDNFGGDSSRGEVKKDLATMMWPDMEKKQP